MAFSKARRLSDLISATGEVAAYADASIVPADLHSTLDLTGKTITVANTSTGDSDTTVANTAFVQQEIAALVASAPGTLNTLNELAAALGDDASFSTTVTNSIATKLPLAGGTMTGNLTVNAIVDADNFKINGGQGSDGQLLTSTGSGVAWEDAPAGGVAGIVTSANATAITIDSSENVGIGTTPNSILHVLGTENGEGASIGQLRVQSSTAFGSSPKAGIVFTNQHTSGSQAIMGGIYVGKDTTVDTNYSGHMAFSTRLHGAVSQERMRIDSSGDVRLAANATGAALVKGVSGDQADRNAGGYPQFTFVGNEGTGMRRPITNTLAFDTSGDERLRIASAGQIGIGGANYGTDGQLLTSTGASSAPAWEDAPASGPSKGLAMVLGMIF